MIKILKYWTVAFCILIFQSNIVQAAPKGISIVSNGSWQYLVCPNVGKCQWSKPANISFNVYISKKGTAYDYSGKNEGTVFKNGVKDPKTGVIFRATKSGYSASLKDSGVSLVMYLKIKGSKCSWRDVLKFSSGAKVRKRKIKYSCRIHSGNKFSR